MAVLHNNIGWAYIDRKDYQAALGEFEAALAARRQEGADPETIRIAEYAIGVAWRGLGRIDEALALQKRIAAEAEASGRPDPFFAKEVAECLAALGHRHEARRWAQEALQTGAQLFSPEEAARLGTIVDSEGS